MFVVLNVTSRLRVSRGNILALQKYGCLKHAIVLDEKYVALNGVSLLRFLHNSPSTCACCRPVHPLTLTNLAGVKNSNFEVLHFCKKPRIQFNHDRFLSSSSFYSFLSFGIIIIIQVFIQYEMQIRKICILSVCLLFFKLSNVMFRLSIQCKFLREIIFFS